MPPPAENNTENLATQLYAEIESHPAFAAEQALEGLSEIERLGEIQSAGKLVRKLLNVFARSALSVAGVEDALHHASPVDGLFAPSLSFRQKELVSIFLLRLFTEYPAITRSPEFSLRAPSLFDEVFHDNLYRVAKVDVSTQPYAKIEALRALLQSVERELMDVVNSLDDLDGLGGVKQTFLKKINAGVVRKVVHPFVPEQLRDQRLSSLLTAAEAFGRESGASIVDSYRRLTSDLARSAQLASDTRTKYAELYCGSLVVKVQRLVDQHFHSTPFSRPANIGILASEKKYPLSLKGSECQLFVDVTNSGPGFAFGVDLFVTTSTENISIDKRAIHLGGVEVGRTQVGIPVVVQYSSDSTLVEFKCSWTNFDGSLEAHTNIVEFPQQRCDVDWARARTEDPYSLGAILTVTELVGRHEIINQLIALTTGPTVGSALIRGQRRVGKTSIVNALKAHLQERFKTDYVVVLLEGGKYVGDDARTTVQFLGRKLCRAIRKADGRFANVEIPSFEGALSPLVDFLEDVHTISPGCRILFILDEFDDLPLDLYRKGLIGDAFFRTLRSISNDPQIGFILVGSEKMEYVLSCQGDALNKFASIAVDYFDKRTHWADFQDLIKRPTASYLEFSESAIDAIYEECAGNPFYAKLICRDLFALMVERRDGHVTPRDVKQAVEQTLEVEVTNFQHFWTDGIREIGTRFEEISITRRRVLLSIADCLKETGRATRQSIESRSLKHHLAPAQLDAELRDFERRKVLCCEASRDGSIYRCKIPLFQEWLVRKGYQAITTAFVDAEAAVAARTQQEKDRVKDEEIADVVSRWDLYLGQRITKESVRAWLAQFGEEARQRLMFQMLQAIRFYSGDRIRQKLREGHGIVGRTVIWQVKKQQPKRRDLVVTALGGLAHSGSEYARRYADENMIFGENVVPISDLDKLLAKRSGAQAVVVVDDFVGTGETLASQIETNKPLFAAAYEQGVKHIFLLICVGFAAGQSVIESAVARHDLSISVHCCDSLSEKDRLFSEHSAAFPDPSVRMQAKDVAYEHGVSLLPDAPLGYGDTQAAVVFENKIPNNCPPILWKETNSWRALFRRT
jgi:hypothetical protein